VRALDLLVDGLATERITRLVVDDKLTEPIREYIWRNHPPEETKIGYFVTCPWCTSIWAAALVVAGRTVAPKTWDKVAQALAFSMASGVISGLVNQHL
jgi:hypothetical protein